MEPLGIVFFCGNPNSIPEQEPSLRQRSGWLLPLWRGRDGQDFKPEALPGHYKTYRFRDYIIVSLYQSLKSRLTQEFTATARGQGFRVEGFGFRV